MTQAQRKEAVSLGSDVLQSTDDDASFSERIGGGRKQAVIVARVACNTKLTAFV